ncbi:MULTISPECIES: hypothetical protein [unclassified Nocardia]|uniref:hypothetical protein n=1 Tax=unclassified Nocardia TaxID=2637762 RepID=UPI00278BD93D|nr:MULTISPECIES: hypothetical protein [unclassified Nocardia]
MTEPGILPHETTRAVVREVERTRSMLVAASARHYRSTAKDSGVDEQQAFEEHRAAISSFAAAAGKRAILWDRLVRDAGLTPEAAAMVLDLSPDEVEAFTLKTPGVGQS